MTNEAFFGFLGSETAIRASPSGVEFVPASQQPETKKVVKSAPEYLSLKISIEFQHIHQSLALPSLTFYEAENFQAYMTDPHHTQVPYQRANVVAKYGAPLLQSR